MPTRSAIFCRPVLADSVATEMAGYVAGRWYSSGIANLYSSGTTRNGSLWLAGVDVSAFAYTRAGQSLSTLSPGFAITDRDVLFADHVFFDRTQVVGQTVRFVSMDGTVVDRTISAVTYCGFDQTIGRMSSALPASVTPAKLMPPDWQDYLPGATPVPAVYTEQHRTLRIGVWTVQNATSVNIGQHADYPDWYTFPVNGDSGCGAGFVVGGELVAIGTFASATNFSHVTGNPAALAALAGTPQYADLSRYRSVA